MRGPKDRCANWNRCASLEPLRARGPLPTKPTWYDNSHITSSLYGSYSAVRYDGSAKTFICANYTTPAKAVSVDFSCNPDYNVSQLGLLTRWPPVKNLTFSAEVQWFHLHQKFTGAATLAASSPKPTAVYEFKDQDTVHLQLRAQRNF